MNKKELIALVEELLQLENLDDRSEDLQFLRRQYKLGKSATEMAKMCKDKGLPYTESDIARFEKEGWLSGSRKYTKQEIKDIKNYNKTHNI